MQGGGPRTVVTQLAPAEHLLAVLQSRVNEGAVPDSQQLALLAQRMADLSQQGAHINAQIQVGSPTPQCVDSWMHRFREGFSPVPVTPFPSALIHQRANSGGVFPAPLLSPLPPLH